ncbi:coiled-coil domain-containing protein [Raoultibacter phocaeensis]|uniref:coiled-coil domain-containing protein n=1 Tax=Raoultibacter phocaeensis TaxID=2479841 RepID=UPI002103EB7D|nr:hypothetical protein [Raoultibacter phocaeensis]
MATLHNNRTVPTFDARKAIACLAAFVLAFSLALPSLSPASAQAETNPIIAEPDELQQKIEQTAAEYDEAVANLEAVEQQIEDTHARIDELNANLPAQQEKSGDALKALYNLQQEGFSLMDMLLGAGTIEDFLTTYEYIDRIHTKNVNEINRLTSMKQELEDTEKDLEDKKQEAETEKIRAEDALKSAQAAREEAQRKAEEAAAAEQKAAEEAAKVAEAAEAEKKAAEETEQKLDEPSSSGSVTQEPESPSENVDWSTDKQAFVNEWTPRIDAYLSGSPLAGQGKTFAEAAWNYGVDPRWSPAISLTESSKGAACAYPHNAWGWGTISWSSWEEAINAHVRGLARGYGYTITVDAAKKYCPPNWEHWYNTTLAQMEMI